MKGALIILLIAGAIYFFLVKKQAEKTLVVAEEGISAIDKAKNTAQFANWAHITQALSSYVNNHGDYPDRLEDLLPNYIHFENQLRDPWGKPVRYEKGNGSVTLRSAGNDGEFNTDDDLIKTL